ncbi:P-loop containing nucleoside triphosphate hydrolase protein [Neurospora tetraspora]|uniref:P-loop containing nucleoside triphosphate hydrolase protein n=1 Tax=Neurospora tetraspora TaxID=94610 RepID=A0AAE0J966_9PEZI|nr:P-loop containing nucleoside triphosphate hydrolase protein [Neurospora tetraspora]
MANVDAGTRLESLILRRKYDPKTREEKEVKVHNLKSDALSEEQRKELEHALVIRQVYDQNGRQEKTILNVNSPFILRAFRDVIKSHPIVPSTFEEPFELESPFQMLIHHWDDLDVHRRQTSDYDVRSHLNLLFDFMESELGPDYQRLQAMWQKGHITYETLWSVFKPGSLLITFENGHPWLLRCLRTGYEVYNSIGPVCHIYGQYTDFDGKTFGNATQEFQIRQKVSLNGLHPGPINQLPIFPLAYWTKDETKIDDLKRRLQIRGEAFKEIDGVALRYYHGTAKYLKEPPMSYYHPSLEGESGLWIGFTESARVVLDRVLFDEEIFSERKTVAANPGADLTLCPPYTKGFSPAKKTFCRYYLDCLRPIDWKPDAWESLLLPNAQKRILRALVENHIFPDNARDEDMQKGKGLVLLLHGSPGSGKTMTAETAAEATKKLLISSSLGELNRDNWASEFERRLKELLHYATKWQAVVLLDEADVFLEKREDAEGHNADRNALVAVFLKHLEYFSGIVFLTTNRVRSFDAAMKSRIHLALTYGPPDLETRRQLWMKYLGAIPKSEISMGINEDIDELLTEKLNGREISYAVNTARTIARHERQPLSLDHLMTVILVRQEFDKSLKEVSRIERKDSVLDAF